MKKSENQIIFKSIELLPINLDKKRFLIFKSHFFQIVHDSTGFLCEPTKELFSRSMARFVIGDRNVSENMGEKGRKRVQQHFSFEAFTDKLNEIIRALTNGQETTHNGKKND